MGAPVLRSGSGEGGFAVRFDLRRHDAAGEPIWSYPSDPAQPSQLSVVQLADGSVLIIWEDGREHPRSR